MERTTAVALLLFVALRLCAAFSSAPSFEVTQYFSLAANSTCGGDPPTLFQDQFNGVFANCSIGEHDPQLAVDGDLETWWQSANGDTPVGLVFSLEQVRPAANAKFEATSNFIGKNRGLNIYKTLPWMEYFVPPTAVTFPYVSWCSATAEQCPPYSPFGGATACNCQRG